ncbi:lactonase family protein [Phytoactinopolyspora mesophila]|uniref:Beta-propeller fold lactonase family protein n=1 Tax=Phytoactinopolyspora mesophila TaxID=2650750 RepID=A0A7K3M4B1_9ACTN|nr:lactonase family protein [Phytoactinopolyspora mesophila]NDL57752.1 beta-propeller fold lactonase family protein [Phytoactinopolyspora mesophila]
MRAFLGAATSTGKGTPAAGITVLDIDGPDITRIGGVEAPDPMYLALSGDGRVLYSIAERENGQVRAWTVDGASLTPLGEPQSTGGSGPCHLSIHPSGQFVISACYGSGTVAAHPIHDDGSLGAATSVIQHKGSGPDAARQEGPHAHMIITDPGTGAGRGHVLAADLGTDIVYRYSLDLTSGTLRLADELRTPPGAGPRHLVVHDRFAYVANELDSTVTVMDLDAGAALGTVLTRPEGATEASHPSAIRLSNDGRFLYVANRFVNEIAVLSVHGAELTLVAGVPCGDDHPRDIVLSPDGSHLYSANQFADSITSFRIDQANGLPERVGEPFGVPSPSCIVWA